MPTSLKSDFVVNEAPGLDWGNGVALGLNRYTSGIYNVREYGALGDGTTDDTEAIDDAFTDCGTSGRLYFPPGTYPYDGDGLDASSIDILGAGRGRSVISLGDGKYFLKPSTLFGHITVEDIRFNGGAGAMKHTYTEVQGSSNGAFFKNVWFFEYTTCAVGSLSPDTPNFKFVNCIFDGTSDTSIGLALPGDLSGGYMIGCLFKRDRYHLKLGRGGVAFKVIACDFIRGDAYDATARTDIWLVARDTATNAGNGFTCFGCKFGNENINAADYKILCADEGTTVTDFTDTPHLTTTSSNFIRGLIITHNKSDGSSGASPSLIYTTVDDTDALIVTHNEFAGTAPTQILEFLNASADTSPLNYFSANIHHSSGIIANSNRASFMALDPNEIAVKVKAGAPSDADFANERSGMLALDSTNSRLYVRVGTTWKYAELTTPA